MKNSQLETYGLLRFQQSEKGTLGRILYRNMQICCTLELPWKGNQHDISCIPEGKYKCISYTSPKNGREVWMLQNVPGRSNIEIHNGSFLTDTEGCIIVGDKHTEYKGLPLTNNSKQTLSKIKATMPKEFWLEIKCDGFSNSPSVCKVPQETIKELRA